MSKDLNKKEIERFSRQIILKDIGSLGQKKIKKAKILIIGAGGLGCSVAEFLTRAGVGNIFPNEPRKSHSNDACGSYGRESDMRYLHARHCGSEV